MSQNIFSVAFTQHIDDCKYYLSLLRTILACDDVYKDVDCSKPRPKSTHNSPINKPTRNCMEWSSENLYAQQSFFLFNTSTHLDPNLIHGLEIYLFHFSPFPLQ